VGIVGAQQEQHDGHAEQELLGGSVLCAVINLLPHVEVVKGAAVRVEWHAAHVVEHDVRAHHVCDVGQRPGCLLRHAWDAVVKDLEEYNDDDVDGPGACFEGEESAQIPQSRVKHLGQQGAHTLGIDPVGVEVWQCGLVIQLLNGLERLMVDLEDTARSPPTSRPVRHVARRSSSTRRICARVVGDGASEQDWGRQFGGIGVVAGVRRCGSTM